MKAAVVLIALSASFAGCTQRTASPDIETLMESLELDQPVALDPDCPPVPADAKKILIAGVFGNSPPVLPDAPGFPSDFCPPGTGFFATAEGKGNASDLGPFIWSERYGWVMRRRVVRPGVRPQRSVGGLALGDADASRRCRS